MGQQVRPLEQIQAIRFSRNQEAAALALHLKQDSFVAVSGPGSCGKSTLVNNYLFDELKSRRVEGKAGNNWKIIQVNPGADPIGNLASALAKPGPLGLYSEGEKDAAFRDDVEKLLRTSNDALGQLYTESASMHVEPFNLLIVVDNLQDLARFNGFYQDNSNKTQLLNQSPYGRTGDDVRFVNHLLGTSQATLPVYLILISDNSYQEYYARHRGLLEKMNAYRFSVSNVSGKAISDALLELKKDWPELSQFEAALMKDYSDLTERPDPDPYAMLKLRFGLYVAALDGQLPPLNNVIDLYVREKIYAPMPPELKSVTMLMFKALTGATSFSNTDRIPRSVRQVVDLCDRPPLIQGPPFERIKTVMNLFNQPGEPFLNVKGPDDLPDYAILDISSDALTNSWEQLKEWSTAESNDAEVFKTVYRDALDYYKNFHQTALNNPTAETDKIYTGASLINAMRWQAECMPNPAWANRYLSPPALDLSPDDLKKLNFTVGGKSLQNSSKLDLCNAFLELSRQKYNDELNKKDQALKTAHKQRRRVTIAGVIVSVLALISCFFLYQVWQEKRNITLMNYVKLLDYYDILSLSASSKYALLNDVNKRILKDASINNEHKVLQLLEEEKILRLDGQDEKLKRISYDAMKNLNKLELTIQQNQGSESSKGKIEAVKKEISDIYGRYAKYRAGKDSTALLQLPPLFNTLYAHLMAAQADYQNDGMNESDPSDTIVLNAIINSDCLAANKFNHTDYAYGGINGQVYFKRLGQSVKQLGSVRAPVTSVAFSRKSDELFVGTENGHLYSYGNPAQAPSFADSDSSQAVLVFTVPQNTPIQFVGFCEANGALLIRSNNYVWLLEKGQGKTTYQASASPYSIPLDFVVSTARSPEQKLFFATSYNRSVLYRLDPANSDPALRLQIICRIEHPGRTVFRAAVATRNINGKNGIWMALGTSAGRLWFGYIPDGKPYKSTINLDDSEYFFSPGFTDSPITCITFNPYLPQLACGTDDGLFSVWNMEHYETPAETIQIHTFGEGISNIQYLDKDNLVVYEKNYGWTIKTTLEALWKDLNCVYHNCPAK